ncbi:hypothetical protein [Streptomyces sp. NPDC058045]|uniref:hypothetical protein n=1 Tax=Streptomyces sp. NPDC058045 TaxID=3346311 RepID=UPI0036E1C249
MDAQQISRLTAHWIETLPGEDSTVVSGFGVWPLLALLAEVADGPARDELSAVASGSALDLPDTPELRTALGLWTRPEVPLRAGLPLPAEMRGTLTDQAALDTWVKERTGGLLDRMPIRLDPDILLVLASALAVRTKWALPFKESFIGTSLSRTDTDLDTVRRFESPAGPLTVVTVKGEGDIDVRLVAGETDRPRNAVLSAALRLTGEGTSGTELLAGNAVDTSPAPRVTVASSTGPIPTVSLWARRFEVDAEHNLLDHPDVFGLRTATDGTRGHFPRLSPVPLAVGQAKQLVMARFSADGFEASAATAVAAAPGSMPQFRPPVGTMLQVGMDSRCGFIAVHRPTGTPLVTGWVA